MEKAISLSNKGLTRVITSDGTELNNGIMTGGYRPHLESKQLGAGQVESSIKALTRETHELNLSIRHMTQELDKKESELRVLK